jgi:hypothetical protein
MVGVGEIEADGDGVGSKVGEGPGSDSVDESEF